MATPSTMDWAEHRYTDSQDIMFKYLVRDVQLNQNSTVPRPFIEFPIPTKLSSWETIAQHLVDNPQDTRRAEIRKMIQAGPKKDFEEANRSQPLTQPTGKCQDDASDAVQILTCSPATLLYTRFIMSLPTPEDKYMALSQMKDLGPFPELYAWIKYPDAAVMHHIVYLEDFQATGEDVTGYAMKYDFLTNQIFIKMTQGTPPRINGITLAPWPTSSGAQNSDLFVDTPATLANYICSDRPIAAEPPYDLVLKIIAAEWMCLVGETLQKVTSPDPRGEIFTEKHQQQLQFWLEDTFWRKGRLEGALTTSPFLYQ